MEEGKTVNVGVFGDKGVGKTALVNRFISKKFQNTTTSTFLNMPIGNADVYGNTVKFSIYDVPGSPEYQSLAAGVYAGIEVAILCFDVTSQASFDGLAAWISKLNAGLPPKGVKVLVGLKKDMTRQVQLETTRSFATQNGYMYFEASAKSGQKDVNEVFCVSAAKALDIPVPPPPDPKPKGLPCCCFM